MGMFDAQELGIPALSLKAARRGLKVEGIILPIPKLNPRSGVVDLLAYREDPDIDQAGQPKLYPSGDPILVGQMLLQTRLRNWDLTSAEFEKRTEEFPDETDAGLRRWFVGSKYASKAVKAAYKKLRVAPEVGGTFTLEVLSVESDVAKNGDKYTYPNLLVNWTPADADGKAVANAYAETMKMPEAPAAPAGGAFANAPSGDSSAAGGSSDGDDEPPF